MEQSKASPYQRLRPRRDSRPREVDACPAGPTTPWQVRHALSRLFASSTAALLGIVVLAAVVHGVQATNLGLYWDDSDLLMQPYQALEYQPLRFVFADTFDSLRSERPASYLVYVLARAAFVQSLALVHWLVIALFTLNAIVLARVSRLLVPEPWFPFACAVTLLLYPLGSVHAIWPSTVHYLAASLFAFWTILAALRAGPATGRRRVAWLALATAAYAACLLTHEVFALVPLAFLGAYLIAGESTSPDGTGKLDFPARVRVVVVCTAPLVMALAAYAVWRLFVLPTYGGPVYSATEIVSSPSVIALKALRGVVTTIFPWTHVAIHIWLGKPSTVWVISALAVSASVWMVMMRLMRSSDLSGTDAGRYWRAALVGLAMLAAGAVAIAVSPVTVKPVFGATFGSRANFVVVPAIALAVPALIVVLIHHTRRWATAFPAMLLSAAIGASIVAHGGFRNLLAETLLSPNLFWSYSTGRKLVIGAYASALITLAAIVLVALLERPRSRHAVRIGPLPQARSRPGPNYLVATALSGLVFVGSLLHFSAKGTFLSEWAQHKAMLEDVQSLAPQLEDDTFVVIVNEDPKRLAAPWGVPFADHGELSGYMRALYDNASITANVHRKLRFSRDGVTSLTTRTHAIAPAELRYDQLVLFRYDGRSLTNLPELAVTTEEGEPLIVKSNTARVVSSGAPVTTRIWRHVTR